MGTGRGDQHIKERKMMESNKDLLLVSKRRLSNVLVTGVLFFIIPVFYRVIDPSGELSNRLNEIGRLDPNPMATLGITLILTYTYIRTTSTTENKGSAYSGNE